MGFMASSLKKIIGLVALPRSGTTVVTSVLGVHSRVKSVYEPWNAAKEKINPANRMTFDEFMTTFNINVGKKTIMLVKETATQISFLERLNELLLTAPHKCDRELIVLLRNPFHIFLSEIQARREWWGEPNLIVTTEIFDAWAHRTLGAMRKLIDMAKSFNAMLLSYEAISRSPMEISRVMEELGLEVEAAQYEFERHVDVKLVRGDKGLAARPRPLTDSSVSSRETEVNGILGEISDARSFSTIMRLHKEVASFEQAVIGRSKQHQEFTENVLRSINEW
jgi:hypothetical protein